MANFDWNEIIVTSDGNVANEHVSERMILVTGEKGDSGKDGRGILRVRKTGLSDRYVTMTIDYDDGTKSNFTVELPSGQGGNFDTSVIAQQFDASQEYFVGDYVIYEGMLYCFSSHHSVAPWNENHVTEASVTGNFVDMLVLNLALSRVNGGVIAPIFDEQTQYSAYDYVIYDGRLYQFWKDHLGAWKTEQQWIDYWEVTVSSNFLDWRTPILEREAIAPVFNEETQYYKGDYVIYNDMLYQFTKDHAPGEWKSNIQWKDADQASVSSRFIDWQYPILKREAIAPVFDEETQYYSGDYVIYNNLLYQFTKDHRPGAWITDEQWIDAEEVSVSSRFLDWRYPILQRQVIAPVFSEETSYNSGDFVIYNNLLYRFTSDHPAGEWDTHIPLDHQEVSTTELIAYNTELIKLRAFVETLADYFQNNQNYNIGDYVTYNGSLYKFTSYHQAGNWNPSHVIAVNVMEEIDNNASIIGTLSDSHTVKQYKAGDYVLHRNQNNEWRLYRFIKDHGGAWNFSDVEETVLTDGMSELRDRIGAQYFDQTVSYSTGDVVIYNDKLYRFIQNHSAGTWNNNHAEETTLIDLLKKELDTSVIASEFSAQTAYNAGDYVMHDGKLYRFSANHSAGAWTGSDVVLTVLADNFVDNRQFLVCLSQRSLSSSIAPEFSNLEAYSLGDYVMHEGQLYKFTTAHSAGAWNSQEVTEQDIIDLVENIDPDTFVFRQSIAEDFDSSSAYAIGDYVWYNNYLYCFNSAHVAGAWNSSEVSRVVVTENFAEKSYVVQTANGRASKVSIAPDFSESVSYSVGDRVQVDGELFEFTTAHPAGAWNSSHVLSRNLVDIIHYEEAKLANRAPKWAIAEDFDTTNSYLKDDYVIYDDRLYKFNTNHSGAWDATHADRVKVATELQDKIGDAPTDNKYYARQNGAWAEIQTDSISKVELYVDGTNGSDSNDGSQAHPFKTIGKSVSAVPENGIGIITVASGSYSASLSIENKSIKFIISGGNNLSFTSQSDNTITNSQVTFYGYSESDSEFSFTGKFKTKGSKVVFDHCKQVNANLGHGKTEGAITVDSSVFIANCLVYVTIYGTSGTYYILARNGSYMKIGGFTRPTSGGVNKLLNSDSSVIICSSILGQTDMYFDDCVTANGGRIFLGEQAESYSKQWIDDKFDFYYDKTEINALLADYYDKDETDSLLAGKAEAYLREKTSGSLIELTSIGDDIQMVIDPPFEIMERDTYRMILALSTIKLTIGAQSASDWTGDDTESWSVVGDDYTHMIAGCIFYPKTGRLLVTWKYIYSYNGETLPDIWYSSVDTYAPGTTPTTGAKVVYRLAVPEEMTLTPTVTLTSDMVGKNFKSWAIYSSYVYFQGQWLEDYSEYIRGTTSLFGRATDIQTYIDEHDAEKVTDAPSDNKKYARKNGEWTEITSGGSDAPVWGDITGTLSDQLDLQTALSAKQDTLTFDNAPTASSTNPVTSGGVYTAVAEKVSMTYSNGYFTIS